MYKRLMCVVILCAIATPEAAPAGMIGWWKLDETTGTTVGDASGSTITGNFVGTPTWATGQFGGALQLDGKSWVDFGNPPKTLATGTTPVSIALWINPSNLGTALGVSGHDRSFLARNQNWIFKASGPYARFTTPGVLDHNGMNAILKTNEWQHVVVTFQPSTAGGCVFYLNGVETDRMAASAYNAAAATTAGPVLLGNNQFTSATVSQCYFGLFDEVQLYNRVLTLAQVKEILAGARAFFPKAWNPSPADKAVAVSQPVFQWTPGEDAVLHNVYIGMTPELTQANLVGANVPATPLAVAAYYYAAGLQPGVVHYWRVDEVDASGKVTTGDIWSFTATPKTAWAQKPADGATYLPVATTLAWSAGVNAALHDVYLSTDRAAVEAGTAAAKKGDKQATTTYAAANLERGQTYYWRVDERLMDGTVVPGPVWSFTIRPVIAKGDPSLLTWWKLEEENSTFAADYSGNDYYGTLQGSPQWVDGYLGAGLRFNGSTDYVDFGAVAALFQPKTYTYCAWFKVGKDIAGNSGAQYLLCLGSRSDLVFGVEDTVGTNGDLSLHYYDTTPGFHAISVGRTLWPADEWHMVAATKDATGHKIYLDGVLKGADTNTKDDNYNTTRMISLGARGWTTPKVAFFNGVIDDVRIYNKALTADEIQQTMRGDPLLAWDPQPKSNTPLDIRDVTDLSWSAGNTAAQHDVYLGQDKDAVKAADPTSPLYQGRQANTSFPLAGRVKFGGGSYFWRIDEIEADGKTIRKGVIWSFTVLGYLLVDEFESYNDTDNRIYDTWIDGITDGKSGSMVGYGIAPFAERTIIHSGKQSLPMDYNNIKSPFFSEAAQTFAPLQDWTGTGVTDLSLWFRGRLATPALVETPPGQYKIGSVSGDIESTSDSFRFFYKTLTGDGSITAKVLSVTNTAAFAKVGVMIRESLDPSSTYAIMFPTPDRRRAFQNRPTTGGTVVSAHSAAGAFVAFPFWVRLERKANQFTAYYSPDGTSWTRQPDTENTGTNRSLNPVTISMGASVCIGLAVTSNNTAAVCFGEFSDVATTGSVTSDWKLVKVGPSYSNDPDRFYAVVEDSTGKSVMVPNPDPAAVNVTTWTEWKIPLNTLAGLNLAKVKKLYVGVGDTKTLVPGATGRMYIDDIRVIKQ
jgi:hypothetical protein